MFVFILLLAAGKRKKSSDLSQDAYLWNQVSIKEECQGYYHHL